MSEYVELSNPDPFGFIGWRDRLSDEERKNLEELEVQMELWKDRLEERIRKQYEQEEFHGVPDQSGKGWHRDRELCKQGHNNWAMRSSQGKMKRYCVTCNSERKKRK